MNFYSKVLALYTSFPTESRAYLNINGVNYMLHATLQTLTYFHSTYSEEHNVYTRLTYTKITKECRLLNYQVFKNRRNTSSVNDY